MNNKGQVFVLFVILIPVFLIFAAFVIDIGNTYNVSNKINHINKMVIRYGLNHINETNVREKMINLMYMNDSKIDEYHLTIENKKIALQIKKSVDGVFSKMIGIKLFYTESKYKGYINAQGKIIIEKGQ